MIFLKAFLVGGLICVVGQLLIDWTKLTPARILVSFVVLGVILGGLGVYQPLVEWAGAGATVPLTGFGNTLVQGTKEALREDGALGILTGPLSSASVGITVAMVSGLLVSFVSKSKSK
ncbi:MAG: stage V sporulation protein AE [Clostridia bacterium]|nr:stage V sporulation protein AE [Clostridia bacterium]